MNIAAPSDKSSDLQRFVESLVEETNELLSDTVAATKRRDARAKQLGLDWTRRHRLQVLLEAAEHSRSALPGRLIAPWFLVELRTTLDVVSRWCTRPSWNDIEPSLKDSRHFQHTILKLHVADHLESGGHEVRLVARSATRSPDLEFRAIGGSRERVLVECYCPLGLSGKPEAISAEGARVIINKAMRKAREQLPPEMPGILAIGGYNQPATTLDTLKWLLTSRLRGASRPQLCGVAVATLGVLFSAEQGSRSFTATFALSFVPNSGYAGTVDVETKVPDHRLPQLIKTPLTDVTTDKLSEDILH